MQELLELLELRPDPIIDITPGGRVLAYATQSSAARAPGPGPGLFREEVTVFFDDADTNVRALRACKALIVAGFEVDAGLPPEIAGPSLSHCFVITAWRDVAEPALYLDEEVGDLVTPFGGEITHVEQIKHPNIYYIPNLW